ncbi:glycosyltransferase [Antarcticibacterium arcticum]|uniref:Glycosyltransferase n=1 Tax=Antarcticibacterium arcticum TaxID=2585771 RepID=A0A5B8YII2_9FLAO|nr:glycosyltransferase [Antarcticibacterium arcticum]QED37742.1 glycosyltransferase [Antarcticibacterium arcticum]
MSFSIFTHVLHTIEKEKFVAYAPYIREMNIWLKHVGKVEIVAPLKKCSTIEVNGGEYYQHQKLVFSAIPSVHLLTFKSISSSFWKLPLIFLKVFNSMLRAEHVHLRCPGNIGLIGCLLQIFFPHKPKTAKYAGNWDPEAKQPWSYKLQKWILSNTILTRNMTVLVYGKWPNQTKNILPFFTASFKESEKEVVIKDFKSPYKFLFVGGLVIGKQPSFAIKLVEALNNRSIPAEIHIYGDGPLKNDLEKVAKNKDYIHLHGNQPLDVLKQHYKDAHFLILASKSEGWPKAVAEAMFFGCIPIATAVSCVPWMLAAPPPPKGEAKMSPLLKGGF